MKNFLKVAIALTISSFMINAFAISTMQHWKYHPKNLKQPSYSAIFQCEPYITLNSKQKAAVKVIRQNYIKQIMPTRRETYAKAELLEALLDQSKLNIPQINTLVKQVSALQVKLFMSYVQMREAIIQKTGASIPVRCIPWVNPSSNELHLWHVFKKK